VSFAACFVRGVPLELAADVGHVIEDIIRRATDLHGTVDDRGPHRIPLGKNATANRSHRDARIVKPVGLTNPSMA
jgi:hypothetical protein